MSTRELLNDALKPLSDWLGSAVGDDLFIENSEEKRYTYETSEAREGIRLRVHYELSREVLPDAKIGDLITLVMYSDLIDLIENGDTNDVSDWLRKSMDGSKKRDKEPVRISIPAAELLQKHHKIKDTNEYTLFIILSIDWE